MKKKATPKLKLNSWKMTKEWLSFHSLKKKETVSTIQKLLNSSKKEFKN